MKNEKVMTPSQVDAAYDAHPERNGTPEPFPGLRPLRENPQSGAVKGEGDGATRLPVNPPTSGVADDELQRRAHKNLRSTRR